MDLEVTYFDLKEVLWRPIDLIETLLACIRQSLRYGSMKLIRTSGRRNAALALTLNVRQFGGCRRREAYW